jgi:hypothetical protein
MIRAILGCVLVATAVSAAAQSSPASPADSGRQFEAGRGAELENWQWRAQRGLPLSEAEKAVQTVVEAVSQRDCAGAASRLNAGLAKGYPEVMLLAGAMYEDGVCLKQNWDRAATVYQRADAAGHPSAAARLAAGYAAPSGGRDLAASLWWAARARTTMPTACASVAPLVDDPDRFVAALRAWPSTQLGACVYAAAVMSALQGELASPNLAAAYGLEGTVTVSFVPAQGKLDVSDELAPAAGAVMEAATRDAQARVARTALQQQLRQVADAALKRHAKPTDVPADWRIEMRQVLTVAR